MRRVGRELEHLSEGPDELTVDEEQVGAAVVALHAVAVIHQAI